MINYFVRHYLLILWGKQSFQIFLEVQIHRNVAHDERNPAHQTILQVLQRAFLLQQSHDEEATQIMYRNSLASLVTSELILNN